MTRYVIHNHFPARDTIHPDYVKVKHIAAVRVAVQKLREAYRVGGYEQKEAEEVLNAAVEKALQPTFRDAITRDVVSDDWHKAVASPDTKSVDLIKANEAEEYRLRNDIKKAKQKGDSAKVKSLGNVLKHVTGRGSSAVNMAVQKETAAANPPPLDAQPAAQLVPGKKVRDASISVQCVNPAGETYTHHGTVSQRNTSTENEHRRAVEKWMNSHPDHSKHGPWKVRSSQYTSADKKPKANGRVMDAARPSGAWEKAMSDPNLKSYEVAGANAKELYRLRKEIDLAERARNSVKVDALKAIYTQVEVRGRERHQSMPVHGVMQNTSRAR